MNSRDKQFIEWFHAVPEHHHHASRRDSFSMRWAIQRGGHALILSFKRNI